MSDKPVFRVGDYVMHHMRGGKEGTLVLLESETANHFFFILYVPNGGSSGGWPLSDMRPITDPILLATANAHRCRREARDCEVRAQRLQVEASKWDGAIECLKTVRKHFNVTQEDIDTWHVNHPQ